MLGRQAREGRTQPCVFPGQSQENPESLSHPALTRDAIETGCLIDGVTPPQSGGPRAQPGQCPLWLATFAGEQGQ